MTAALLSALVGILHVHHEPSHDSDAPFEEVLEGARAVELDFLVLTEHYDGDRPAPLPAEEHAGVYAGARGKPLLVLVGVELAAEEGHLLALDVPRAYATRGRTAGELIGEIHEEGGFAVAAHPFSHGGFHAWDAPIDGMEVHNHATELRRLLGPLLPLRLIRLALDRETMLGSMLGRPERELARWEELLASGRRIVAFSGADAHRNVSLLGWDLDPYAQQFRTVQTLCPDGPLSPEWIWTALREGRCWIRYALYADRASEAKEVRFPSGRVELQLDGGRRVLEIRNPPPSSPR
jgi:predicted metal-dependent phosphoesterase TrpH